MLLLCDGTHQFQITKKYQLCHSNACIMFVFAGWFLAPICFGFIIDTTCLIWNTSCSGQGACALYNAKNMRLRYYGVFLASRIAALLFVIFAYRKARTKYNWSVEEHNHCPGDETNDVMLQRKEDNDNLRWEQNESSF